MRAQMAHQVGMQESRFSPTRRKSTPNQPPT
jgi:hypothetical protein